ncbi:MAG: 1-acyl-sn-glycerol-3-phosphate acyltransferase [Bacteroides sp.]|nr:1-acyl-sn-glycerol-3-phosphate acyltransferase [Bacteroides sp.]
MRILYIIYQICIGLPIFLVLTILTALVTTLGCWLGNGHFWGYYPGKIWSELTCIIFLLPIKVEGKENIDEKTSYVFLANHQGAFDIFLIYGYLGRNFKWMMKKSLRKIPFVGKACEMAGFIFVDKSSPRKIYETIKNAERVLQGGTSMVVFPEGARTFSGHMREFKKGAFQMADQLQLPVVPMTIDGSFDILPRTSKLLHWHRMKLTIHKPIYPIGKGPENQKMLLEESYKAIESGLPEKYKGQIPVQ